jgi:NADH-quinone oxidoreductase subunit G
VRFSEEVAGVPELGMLYRGEDAQITSYLERAVSSEMSAISPTSARSAHYCRNRKSFEFRPWELRRVPAIDVMDAVGSNIRLDVRQRQVMRILPRINEEVNEEWIPRQDAAPRRCAGPQPPRPAVGARDGAAPRGELEGSARAVRRAAQEGGLEGSRPSPAIVDAETMSRQEAARGRGRACSKAADGLAYDTSACRQWRSIRPLPASKADAMLLVAQPLGSAAGAHRFARRHARARLSFASARSRSRHAGVDRHDLKLLGNFRRRSEAFDAAEPAVIVGRRLAADALGAALALSKPLGSRDGWNGFNVVHTAASRMAGLILGYAQRGGHRRHRGSAPGVVLLLGADEVAPDRFRARSRSMSAITATLGAKSADLILPALPTPKSMAPTSTWKAGCSGARKRCSRRARRARTGRSSARSPSFSASRCRSTASTSFARDDREYPQLGRDGLIDLPGRRRAGRQSKWPSALSDQRLLPDQRDRSRQHRPLRRCSENCSRACRCWRRRNDRDVPETGA